MVKFVHDDQYGLFKRLIIGILQNYFGDYGYEGSKGNSPVVLPALLFQVIHTSSLTSVLIVLWRYLRGLIGGGFLTSGTVSNRIYWLLLDLPGLPAADHYNVYVLFICNIDFDCNMYIPLLFTI